jgi:hypothetical protein
MAAPSRGTAATLAGNTGGGAASTTAGTALPPSKPKSGPLWPLALAAGVVVLGGAGAFALWFGAGASNAAGTTPDGVAPLVSAQPAVTRADEDETPPAKSVATEPPSTALPSTENTAPVVSVAPLAASARPSSESTASAPPRAQAPKSNVTKKPPSGVGSPPPSKQPERTEKPPPKPGKSATPDMGF